MKGSMAERDLNSTSAAFGTLPHEDHQEALILKHWGQYSENYDSNEQSLSVVSRDFDGISRVGPAGARSSSRPGFHSGDFPHA